MKYPYNSPQILTNAIFAAYGGDTDTYTEPQKTIAWWLAEQQMTEHLQAYLKITTVTGTYPYEFPGQRLRLDHGYLISVDAVLFNYFDCDCVLTQESGCATILDAEHGFLILNDKTWTLCGCATEWGWPLNVDIVDTSGLASGTVYQPNMLLALQLAATVNLRELFDPFALEGGAGDPGIQEWSSMSHREVRRPMGTNVFGNGPIANKIARLVSGLEIKPAIKLGG